MTKKVIGLGLAGLIVLSLAVGGTWAYIVDAETSSNNQVTAGTVAMTTNDNFGVTQSLVASNLKPGRIVGPTTITLKNVGSLTGSSINISLAYTENDVTPNTTNMTADQMAGVLEITGLSYDSRSILSALTDSNANGYKDIYDLSVNPRNGLVGLNPSASKDFSITVQMRAGTSSDYCGDGINITLTFVLNQ